MPVTQRVSEEATERRWNNPCHLLRPNPLLYVLSVFSLCSHTADPPLYSHSQAERLWLNSHHPFSLLCSPSHLLYLKYPVLYFYGALSSLPSLRPPTVFHFTLLSEEGYSYAVPGRTQFDGRRMLGLSLSNSLEGTEFKLLQSIGNVFCAASSDKTHRALLYMKCPDPGFLSLAALHEFPTDLFTNKERTEGAVALHVLCVSLPSPTQLCIRSPVSTLEILLTHPKIPRWFVHPKPSFS